MATRTERRLAGNGRRFVLLGAPLIVIGVVIALLLDGTAMGIGIAVAVLGALPVALGIALMTSAGVEAHSRKGGGFV
jgi:hypothetical protein